MHNRSIECNKILLQVTSFHLMINVAFDIDSFPIIVDSGTLSTATPHKLDFIPDSYKHLYGETNSSIASGLNTSGIGSVIYKIKDDKSNQIDLQIDHVLYLE